MNDLKSQHLIGEIGQNAFHSHRVFSNSPSASGLRSSFENNSLSLITNTVETCENDTQKGLTKCMSGFANRVQKNSSRSEGKNIIRINHDPQERIIIRNKQADVILDRTENSIILPDRLNKIRLPIQTKNLNEFQLISEKTTTQVLHPIKKHELVRNKSTSIIKLKTNVQTNSQMNESFMSVQMRSRGNGNELIHVKDESFNNNTYKPVSISSKKLNQVIAEEPRGDLKHPQQQIYCSKTAQISKKCGQNNPHHNHMVATMTSKIVPSGKNEHPIHEDLGKVDLSEKYTIKPRRYSQNKIFKVVKKNEAQVEEGEPNFLNVESLHPSKNTKSDKHLTSVRQIEHSNDINILSSSSNRTQLHTFSSIIDNTTSVNILKESKNLNLEISRSNLNITNGDNPYLNHFTKNNVLNHEQSMTINKEIEEIINSTNTNNTTNADNKQNASPKKLLKAGGRKVISTKTDAEKNEVITHIDESPERIQPVMNKSKNNKLQLLTVPNQENSLNISNISKASNTSNITNPIPGVKITRFQKNRKSKKNKEKENGAENKNSLLDSLKGDLRRELDLKGEDENIEKIITQDGAEEAKEYSRSRTLKAGPKQQAKVDSGENFLDDKTTDNLPLTSVKNRASFKDVIFVGNIENTKTGKEENPTLINNINLGALERKPSTKLDSLMRKESMNGVRKEASEGFKDLIRKNSLNSNKQIFTLGNTEEADKKTVPQETKPQAEVYTRKTPTDSPQRKLKPSSKVFGEKFISLNVEPEEEKEGGSENKNNLNKRDNEMDFKNQDQDLVNIGGSKEMEEITWAWRKQDLPLQTNESQNPPQEKYDFQKIIDGGMPFLSKKSIHAKYSSKLINPEDDQEKMVTQRMSNLKLKFSNNNIVAPIDDADFNQNNQNQNNAPNEKFASQKSVVKEKNPEYQFTNESNQKDDILEIKNRVKQTHKNANKFMNDVISSNTRNQTNQSNSYSKGGLFNTKDTKDTLTKNESKGFISTNNNNVNNKKKFDKYNFDFNTNEDENLDPKQKFKENYEEINQQINELKQSQNNKSNNNSLTNSRIVKCTTQFSNILQNLKEKEKEAKKYGNTNTTNNMKPNQNTSKSHFKNTSNASTTLSNFKNNKSKVMAKNAQPDEMKMKISNRNPLLQKSGNEFYSPQGEEAQDESFDTAKLFFNLDEYKDRRDKGNSINKSSAGKFNFTNTSQSFNKATAEAYNTKHKKIPLQAKFQGNNINKFSNRSQNTDSEVIHGSKFTHFDEKKLCSIYPSNEIDYVEVRKYNKAYEK